MKSFYGHKKHGWQCEKHTCNMPILKNKHGHVKCIYMYSNMKCIPDHMKRINCHDGKLTSMAFGSEKHTLLYEKHRIVHVL